MLAHLERKIFGGLAVLALIVGSPNAYAVLTDDFTDGEDAANPAWTHLDGEVTSTGQTWDASTGVYRLQAPSNGFNDFGFVGSHLAPIYTDVRVATDIVDFDGVGSGPMQAFNIMGRSNSSNAFLALTGYAYGFDPLAGANDGEMVLYRMMVNDPLKDIGSQNNGDVVGPLLDVLKDYRVVLEIIGTTIHGQVREIGGPVVAEIFRDISAGDPPPEVYASGTSGVWGFTQSPFETDFSVDNFQTEVALAGDYNWNGTVDAADYTVWRDSVGAAITNSQIYEHVGVLTANGDNAGTSKDLIDAADRTVWVSNFGATVPPGAGSGSAMGGGAAVPEPASGTLVLLGLVSLWLGRRSFGR